MDNASIKADSLLDVNPVSHEAYLKIKTREVNFISSFLDASYFFSCVKSERECHYIKQTLRIRLLHKALESSSMYTETNFQGHTSCDFFNFKFRYNNQRYDLEFLEKMNAGSLYRLEDCPFVSSSFATSGMSAIMNCVQTVKQISNSSVNFCMLAGDEFHESAYIFNNYCEKSNGKEVLFLCSSSSSSIQKYLTNIDDFDTIIIDTTCLDLCDPVIADYVKKCNLSGKTLALVRSHQKLDCFGLEYARLGSIVIVSGQEQHSRYKELLAKTVATTGAQATLMQIYPFFEIADFIELTTLRTHRITLNSLLVEEALLNLIQFLPNINLTCYPHHLFIAITLKRKLSKVELNRIAHGIVDECNSAGILAFYASSFGYDFTAIDSFVNLINGEATIRIAIGDHPPDVIRQLCICLSTCIGRICAE